MATAARDRHQACVRVRAALAAVVALLFCAPAASAQLQPGGRQATVPGELLVQFEPGVSPSARADVRAAAGTHVQSALREPGLQLLDVEPGTSVPEAIRRLERSADVSFAQPNIVYHAAAVVPNDPYFANHDLWGLETIRAPEAWATTVGSPSVTVAVVDSGIASDHPDLTANVDTSRGRDFVDDGFLDGAPGGSDGFDARADPSDHNGHGTHVAGTIAARGNNGRGIAGVTWNSTLVSVRVLDGHAYGESDDLANGLDYAGDIGARVANVSISGAGVDPAVAQAIASHPNTLYVVAAGNDTRNNDAVPQSPCNVDALNVICVAATTQTDRLAGFSNTGPASVDLGAPGTSIYSTQPVRQRIKYWNFEGSDPLGEWTPLGWGLSTARSVESGGRSVTDSPLGPYALNQNTSLITPPAAKFDFTGRKGCAIDYQLALDTIGPARPGDRGDLMRVMTDPGGTTYYEQDTWFGSTQGRFVPERTFLDADGQQAHLRLNFLANGDGLVADGAYVDDVDLTCFAPASEAYVELSGTSMATPQVAGVAALIWAARPGASVVSVRCDLLGSGPVLGDLVGSTVSGRRLDAAAAVAGTRSAVAPAVTGGVDGLSATAATLHGVADPCATASAYQFELGPTTAYGAAAPAAPAALGSGNSPVPVGQAVGGLAPSTTYHYRLVTIRAGVRLPGPDQTFTTPAAAVSPPVKPPALTLRDVKVSCKRTGSGRRRTVVCTLRRATAVSRLSARLTKRGRLYARASGRPPRSGRVKLKVVRRLHKGRYRVTVTLRDRKGAKRTKRLTVRV